MKVHVCAILLISYVVLRHVLGVAPLPILGLVLLEVAYWYASPFKLYAWNLIFLFVGGLSVLASVVAMYYGKSVVTIYLLFLAVNVVLPVTWRQLRATCDPGIFLAVSIVFSLAVLFVHVDPQVPAMPNPFETGSRLKSFFVQTNELGLFASGMFAITLFLPRGEKFLRLARYASTLLLATVIYLTNSFTAEFLCLTFVLLRYLPRLNLLFWGFLALFALAGALDLGFSSEAVELLSSGSLWWRYVMAGWITSNAGFVQLTPLDIAAHGTWSHSIALDLVAVFGIGSAAALLVGMAASLVLLRDIRERIMVLSLLIAATFQPIGALPIPFILIGVAFAYALTQQPLGKQKSFARGHVVDGAQDGSDLKEDSWEGRGARRGIYAR